MLPSSAGLQPLAGLDGCCAELVAWLHQQLPQPIQPSQFWAAEQADNLFSQASWGRLQMKPKRNKGHGLGTLIASLQVLLSKAISLEILQSLRSLLTNSSHVSLGLPLPLFTTLH